MNAKKSQGNAKADSFALDSKLRLYAIAAGAAGVSVLALGRSAAAEIIYTPAHRALPLSGDFQFLDINGDGVPDLAFLHYTYGLSNSFNNVIRVDARNNGVEGIDIRYAEPLSAGATIGQSANFKGGIRSMAGSRVLGYARRRYTAGPWNNVQDHYLGVSFKIGTETHYGWVRMSVSDPRAPLKVLISGYAYETIADQQIRAGQTSGGAKPEDAPQARLRQSEPAPASLGLLAAGCCGLQLWRREETGSATPR